MKLTIYHDTDSKALKIPYAALQLSGLADAEELHLYVTGGCVLLSRPDQTAREMVETAQLLEKRNVTLICRLAEASRKLPPYEMDMEDAFTHLDDDFLLTLERCGVDLPGLRALLEQERG